MTKRKRASLKDKSPESLGLSQKKGKGIDLLFGGPLNQETGQSDVESDGAVESTGVDISTSTGSALDDRPVDELGLPVALESPPDDLILAAPISEFGEGVVDPTTSPFALPESEADDEAMAGDDANDFNGILEEDNSQIVEEENVSNSEKENDLSGIVEDNTAGEPIAEDDLSGLIVEDDLSGLVAAAPPSAGAPDDDLSDLAGLTEGAAATTPISDPANDLSGLTAAGESAPTLVTPPSAAPPPTTAAPINVPMSAYDPGTYAPPPPPRHSSTQYVFRLTQPVSASGIAGLFQRGCGRTSFPF